MNILVMGCLYRYRYEIISVVLVIFLGIYLIKYFKLYVSVIIWKRNIGKYGGFYWLKMDFDIYKKNFKEI